MALNMDLIEERTKQRTELEIIIWIGKQFECIHEL